MSNVPFSKKQIDVLTTPPLPFLVLAGVTGSGKTHIANLYFLYHMLNTAPPESLLLISGNTSESVYDNVISKIMSIDEGRSLQFKSVQSNKRLICKTNGVEAIVMGANTDTAQNRVFGRSIWMWYADEIQKQPRSFVELAVSRGRWVIDGVMRDTYRLATLNPDDPNGYVKTQVIDRILTWCGKYYQFEFEDNPMIADPKSHKESLANKMTGYLRDRLVYGLWSIPENSIIPEFALNEINVIAEWEKPEYYRINAALDPGFNHYTGYVVGYYDFRKATYIVENEAYVNEANSEKIAALIRDADITAFGREADERVSDTDLILIANLNQLHNLKIHSTKKDNLEAQINYARLLFQNGKIKVNPRCSQLIRQLRGGVWNSSRSSFGVDVDGSHFDMIMALVYWIRCIDTTHNPYPIIPKGLSRDDHHIPKINNKYLNTKTMDSLAAAFTRR